LPEPDLKSPPTSAIKWTRRWKYKYPGKRFNAECLVILEGKPHVISLREEDGPVLYRLDPVSNQECQLTPVQVLPIWLAQGADVSNDGKRLAVCTSSALWLMPINADGTLPAGTQPQRVMFPPCSAEACCFDGDDVVILTEKGSIYRVMAADIEARTRFVRPKKRADRKE
jgi:hypothetical protein